MALEINLVEQFLEYLAVQRGSSANTVMAYRRDLEDFAAFSPPVAQVTEHVLKGYLADLSKRELSARTQARRLSGLRSFFRYLVNQGEVKEDPTKHVKLPKLPQALPKALSVEAMQKLLSVAQGSKPQQLRLRLILELLYATGLRISELTHLKVSDIIAGEDEVLRITGKGDKTRLVPLGENTGITLALYLEHARPTFNKQGDWVFPSARAGKPLTRQRMFQLIKQAGEQVGVSVAPHHLRHTFATHLLDNNADLRAVQLMLGHASLQTTQIYTKVAGSRLQEVLETHHPLSNMDEE